MSSEPPVLPDDFFEWRDELENTNEPSRIARACVGVVGLGLFVFVLILIGKAIVWAWVI